jgi:rhomboid protease GluP
VSNSPRSRYEPSERRWTTDEPRRVVDLTDPAAERRAKLLEFRATLFALTPRVYVTHLLVAANIVLFVLMVIADPRSLWSPTTESLLDWGANFGPRTLGGQPWRLFTCTFLHIGILHLAFNMWVLRDVGRLMERVVGNVGFVLLYVVSGLCGSLASVAWNPQGVSAGASGAVFGLFGGLLGFLVLGRGSMPPEVTKSLLNSSVAFVGYNLVFGFMIARIDNAAHLGGLLGGCLCGLCLGQPITPRAADFRWLRNSAVLALGIGITVAGLALLPRPADVQQALRDVDQALKNFDTAEGKALKAYGALSQRFQNKEISAVEFADGVERDVIPTLSTGRQALESLENVPERARPYVAALVAYARLRDEEFKLDVEAKREPQAEKDEELDEKRGQVNAALAEVERLAKELKAGGN